MNARKVALIVAALLCFAPSVFAGTEFPYPTSFGDETDNQQSINDYMSDGWDEESEAASPLLGVTLREEMGRVASGAPMAGMGVTAVTRGGPAERAGIDAPHTLLRNTAVTILFAGGMFFPPAMFGALVLNDSRIGAGHDLIVAVDGYRVHNLFQFRNAMRGVKPGQIVYLRVLRGGERREFRVPIPNDAGLGLTY